jgi:hypothetical protein
MDFSTLRIDGDMVDFDSPWYYGNKEGMPRERFLEIMAAEGFAKPGKFLPLAGGKEGAGSVPGRVSRLASGALSPAPKRQLET